MSDSADGKWVYALSKSRIGLWSGSDTEIRLVLFERVTDADGTHLVFRAQSGVIGQRFGIDSGGQWVVQLRVWSSPSGDAALVFYKNTILEFHRDGSSLARTRLYDNDTWDGITFHSYFESHDGVSSNGGLSFSPDGTHVVTTLMSGATYFTWSDNSGLTPLINPVIADGLGGGYPAEKPLNSMWSPDGSRIYSGSSVVQVGPDFSLSRPSYTSTSGDQVSGMNVVHANGMAWLGESPAPGAGFDRAASIESGTWNSDAAAPWSSTLWNAGSEDPNPAYNAASKELIDIDSESLLTVSRADCGDGTEYMNTIETTPLQTLAGSNSFLVRMNCNANTASKLPAPAPIEKWVVVDRSSGDGSLTRRFVGGLTPRKDHSQSGMESVWTSPASDDATLVYVASADGVQGVRLGATGMTNEFAIGPRYGRAHVSSKPRAHSQWKRTVQVRAPQWATKIAVFQGTCAGVSKQWKFIAVSPGETQSIRWRIPAKKQSCEFPATRSICAVPIDDQGFGYVESGQGCTNVRVRKA